MKKIIVLFTVAVFLVSCNNSGNKNSEKKSAVQRTVDSLWKLLDETHVAAMSKMGTLSHLQSTFEHLKDSIGKLPEKNRKSPDNHIVNLDSLLSELKAGQDEMDKWMNEFNYDSAENNLELRAKYFEAENIKVSKVKDDMQRIIQKADSLLRKK